MASMIDVVFLLLIFFMCTTTFDKLDPTLRSEMPATPKNPQQQQDFEPIQIQVRPAARGALVTIDGQACADFRELYGRLRARRQVADVPVIIMGHEEVPFEYMVAALDACNRAGLEKTALSVRGAGIP